MANRAIIFVVFAGAMLFSITREWNAPLACPRAPVHRVSARFTSSAIAR
jgi:hypothetical protein